MLFVTLKTAIYGSNVGVTDYFHERIVFYKQFSDFLVFLNKKKITKKEKCKVVGHIKAFIFKSPINKTSYSAGFLHDFDKISFIFFIKVLN